MTRKQTKIYRTARRMARQNGLANLTCLELCEACKISSGSFAHIMGVSFTELLTELYEAGVGVTPGESSHRNRTPRGAMSRDTILFAAVELSKKTCYDSITAKEVAEASLVSASLVMHYFGSMANLKSEVMKAAIKREILPIIAQGIVRRNPLVFRASDELRRKALRAIDV